MKILFVCSGKSGDSVTPFIKSQGESLVAQGLELDYFTISGKGIKGYLKSIPLLKKHLKANSYDVIHAHYALCGWVAVAAMPKAPVMVSYMGCDVYGDVTPDGKRTERLNILLAKMLQPFVKRIIVKSRNLEKYIYLKKKVHIIPNGVNFERFKPRDKKEYRKRLGLAPDNKLVLFLGNPTDPRKNITLVKKAVEILNEPNIELIAPYPMKHSEVAEYLNAADVFVLTSHLEGSPNVVKEAMACNCPIVGTDVGDVKEVIANTGGCFVTTFNPSDTADNIKQALTFGQPTSGRKDIAHLNEVLVAKKIIGIYEELIR
ncbi:MAG: glycosyltransferase family 4 protein [bacterium]|nr:glycosyltransferase family 4 protein [bacterium]